MVFAMMVLAKIVLYNLLLSQKSIVTRLEQDTGDSDSVKYCLLLFCFSILVIFAKGWEAEVTLGTLHFCVPNNTKTLVSCRWDHPI